MGIHAEDEIYREIHGCNWWEHDANPDDIPFEDEEDDEKKA